MEIQRKEAIKRFEKKVEILEEWLKTEIPYVLTKEGGNSLDKDGRYVLEYFPLSISALRGWNGSKNSDEVVTEYSIPQKLTSAEAWKAVSESLRARVEGTKIVPSLFERLKQKAKAQRDGGRLGRINELKMKLTIAEQNHAGIASEMIALRMENDDLAAQLKMLQRRFENANQSRKSETEWRNGLEMQYKLQIETLEKEKQYLLDQLVVIGEKTGVYPDFPTPSTNVVSFGKDE
ncbi:hypothetical protein [Vibrio parahaemolyticus]|uniref:hypothetical protein n=1 Tax=Vibrio parahaemolyticus TaxID=670 RepID=UPI001110A66C|nr:hypothetical protein [Vibrio parahaemolyticus]TMX34544.1 hypothetical protein DA098_23630 [Vibrio parahaemolyticus]TMX71374.1 hypothetical protein DA094_28260 [Vibrio parahaemolyticus]